MYEPEEIKDEPVAEVGPTREDDDIREDQLILRK
jgi:hypothetical protein